MKGLNDVFQAQDIKAKGLGWVTGVVAQDKGRWQSYTVKSSTLKSQTRLNPHLAL